MKWISRILLCSVLAAAASAMSAQSRIVRDFTPACDSISRLMAVRTGVDGELRLRNIMKRNGYLDFYFTVSLSDFPWRPDDYKWFRTTLRSLFPEGYAGYRLGEIYSRREKAATLTVSGPGYDGKPTGSVHRTEDPRGKTRPVVTDPAKGPYPEGLSGRHIALWPSHGRYFDRNSGKWIWQRPQLFRSVEDMLSTGFVLSYLTPMLENAGAYVMMPRERDPNPVEIIIDNDPSCGSRGHGTYSETGKWEDAGTGFADTAAVYTGHANPFRAGTARSAACDGKSKAVWTPDIPKRGQYAVYISYKTLPASSDSVTYKVHHLGGESPFTVNQQIGGGTWIYLGTFEFAEGTKGYVELSAPDPKDRKSGIVTADAVKIGGGMGNMARNADGASPVTSGLPRYAEAARYWLQWAGIDSSVFSQHEMKDDYRDDLFSRGDWVDFMSGDSHINPGKEGRGIPFDLTFAFHSDAGITPNDSIIGTLSIYTHVNQGKRRLPDGEDRLTAREFADMVQTQAVNDLQACIDTGWTRRHIWDRAYRESRTPPCPTVLLENFSHQNFSDMRHAGDPSFRFILCRAIYKGILKYLSNRYGCPYTVQPLPVHSMAAVLNDDHTVDLSWIPGKDEIEPTAVAKEYRLYVRTDDGGFDTGRKAETWTDPDGRVHTSLKIKPGHVYSYKVTALNDGGESFPSEILAAGIPENMPDSRMDSLMLVVNNFTRVSAPAWFDSPEFAGFNASADPGMPYASDISYTGEMYDFRRGSQYMSNANPGFGASFSSHAGKPMTGNTFDYPVIHGRAIMAAGYPFCSVSSRAFANDSVIAGRKFLGADIICGEQVTVPAGKAGRTERYRVFTPEMQSAIREFTAGGGNILVSGSHIGTDIWDSIFPVSTDSAFRVSSIRFAADVLGYKWVTGHASETNSFRFVRAKDKSFPDGSASGDFSINKDYGTGTYMVVSPDGIAPASSKSRIISEYADTGIPSGTCYTGPSGYKAVCFGFPLEAVTSDNGTEKIINMTITFFRL